MAAVNRIFIKIKRGMTDTTSVCVFPWEKPLVEEIHGGNARVVTIDEMCNQEGVQSVKPLEMKTRLDRHGEEITAAQGMSPREQLVAMTKVAGASNPFSDPLAEWGRLEMVYGANEDGIPVVEKVYLNIRNFRQVLRDFAAGKMPEFLKDDNEPITTDDDEPELSLAEMSMSQLKSKLKSLSIPFKTTDKRDVLEDKYAAHVG